MEKPFSKPSRIAMYAVCEVEQIPYLPGGEIRLSLTLISKPGWCVFCGFFQDERK